MQRFPRRSRGFVFSDKYGWGLVAVLCVVIGVVMWRSSVHSGSLGPDLVQWHEDYAQAVEQAKATGKPMLIDFAAAWCGPCRQMQEQVYAQSKPADFINTHFVPVRIDLTNPAASSPLASQLNIRGLPTIVIQSPKGEELTRQVGYGGKERMLSWLARHTRATDS